MWPHVHTHAQIQAYLTDIAGSVPDNHNTMSIAIEWVVIFFAEVLFVKNATSVRLN